MLTNVTHRCESIQKQEKLFYTVPGQNTFWPRSSSMFLQNCNYSVTKLKMMICWSTLSLFLIQFGAWSDKFKLNIYHSVCDRDFVRDLQWGGWKWTLYLQTLSHWKMMNFKNWSKFVQLHNAKNLTSKMTFHLIMVYLKIINV